MPKKNDDIQPVIFHKKLIKLVTKASHEFNLIQDGDNILLGLSGGKDSTTLAHMLKHLQKHAPFKFTFTAVIVTYGMGEDYSEQVAHCKKYDIPVIVHETNTFDIAKEKIYEDSSFCSFFSRMRRGVLYKVANDMGCNKLALGHHLDDAVESFFMNAMYNGSIRSFPPYHTSENGVIVIRPMTWVREKDLRQVALDNNFPTIGDEMCPGLQFEVRMPYARQATKKLLAGLEKENPHVFHSLKAAMGNVQMDGMLDPKYMV